MYTKIANLKGKFKDVSEVLRNLGCLKTETLLLILTRIDKQKWYYYDRLVSIQELCIAKESYYESLNRFREIDKELSEYDEESIEHVTLSRDTCDINMKNILSMISKYNDECKDIESELNKSYGIYNGLLEQAQNEQELLRMNMDLEKKFHEIEVMSKQADTISPYAMLISNYTDTVNGLISLRNSHIEERNSLNVKLNDIRFTKQELDDELLFQKYLSYMVDATSSKEGIPLEMINDFVVGCKDIVNELVFDIFEEDIEHLNKAYNAGKYVANKFGWIVINCVENGKLLSIDEISNKIYDEIMKKENE